LQGQGAAGVKVSVCRVGTAIPARDSVYTVVLDEDGTGVVRLQNANGQGMSAWKVKGGANPVLRFVEPPAELPLWPGPVTTDAEGRFTLRGIGRNQGVGLQVRDPRYALQALDLKPRQEEKPAEAILALTPARTLEGTVVDADTGKPVPHARLRVPGPNFGDAISLAFSGREADWKGRRTALTLLADVSTNPAGGGRDPLPAIDVRADKEGRFHIPLFPADAYTVRVSGPAGEAYLPMTRGVSWPRASARKELRLALPRGVWVKGTVTETPANKPVAGARVDFWAPGLKLPQGVRFPRSIKTGADGRFEILLPPGSWHLLVNAAASDYVYQKIRASKLTGKQPTPVGAGSAPVVTIEPGDKKHNFIPDGWVALDLKPRADTQRAAVQLERVTLRGQLVGPAGQPVKEAMMFYRHPVPAGAAEVPTPAIDNTSGTDSLVAFFHNATAAAEPRLAPVKVHGGRFEVPLRDKEAKYQLHFLDAQNKWGAIAEVNGKQAANRLTAVKLWSCVSATAQLVDGQGKPRAKYQPLVSMLVPPGPHPVASKLSAVTFSPDGKTIAEAKEGTPKKSWAVRGLQFAPDQIWLGQADPLHYGKGFVTDAQGKLTLPALIPGATYRILNVEGKAKDFKAQPNMTLDLGKLVITEPVRKSEVLAPRRLPAVLQK
jgi:protocatechuate 3,4-dioxygenase beta subunit